MDIGRQIAPLRAALDQAIAHCIDRCQFIQGEQVAAFESAFAEYLGAGHAVGCGSGTDALYLALKALGIGPGDDVLVPAMTFAATPEAVSMAGANPVLIDVEAEHGLLSLEQSEAYLTPRTRAVIFVSLYGNSQGLDHCASFCQQHDLRLVVDAAQAHGGRVHDKPLEDYAEIACYSFYPGKNLGAFGDAGACVTQHRALADDMARRRNHGRSDKYRHDFSGVNMRMDEIQAAILSVKLPHLAQWTERRRRLAARYDDKLASLQELVLPCVSPLDSVWHLFVVECVQRDMLMHYLDGKGIGCGIHYPIPMNLQPAFEQYCVPDASYAVANAKALHSVSLPLFESMTDAELDAVAGAVRDFFETELDS